MFDSAESSQELTYVQDLNSVISTNVEKSFTVRERSEGNSNRNV